jgi:hypothetical protein
MQVTAGRANHEGRGRGRAVHEAGSHRCRDAASWPGSVPLEVYGQNVRADTDRVADPEMCQLAAFAQAVDHGGAHAEDLSYLSD